jgi:hypothetical protein
MLLGQAVNARDTLSVLVIRLTPNAGMRGSDEMTAALGDAIKARFKRTEA